MSSTTFTIRIAAKLKNRLERLAKNTGRSQSVLAAEALNEYLEVNKWQVAGIRRAIDTLDHGNRVPHEAVRAWVAIETLKSSDPKP